MYLYTKTTALFLASADLPCMKVDSFITQNLTISPCLAHLTSNKVPLKISGLLITYLRAIFHYFRTGISDRLL